VNHIAAGLAIGGVWFLVVAGVVAFAAILNWLIGPTFTVAIFATTIVVIIGGTLIDWYTERRQ